MWDALVKNPNYDRKSEIKVVFETYNPRHQNLSSSLSVDDTFYTKLRWLKFVFNSGWIVEVK